MSRWNRGCIQHSPLSLHILCIGSWAIIALSDGKSLEQTGARELKWDVIKAPGGTKPAQHLLQKLQRALVWAQRSVVVQCFHSSACMETISDSHKNLYVSVIRLR